MKALLENLTKNNYKMKTIELLELEGCKVWHDPELGALSASWEGFLKLDHVKEACQVMSSYIKANKTKLLYSNQLNLKVLSKELQTFLVNEWFPQIENLGVERMAILAALDPFAKASMEKVNQRFEGKGSLEVFKFGLEKECLNWLKVSSVNVVQNEQLVNKISAFQMLKVDEEVMALDPLEIDGDLGLIAKFNEERNVEGLIGFLYTKLPTPKELMNYDYYSSLAVMRDIGILLGSIKRHGVEPADRIPELGYILDELSAKTNMPARDTLLHYTMWNPDGDRMRLYTSIEDELGLVQSVKNAFPALEGAIDQLIKLHHTPFESPYFVELCDQAAKKFKLVIDSIVLAHRMVSPEVFAKELRFYFDPINVNGEELIGPGAVEMPMFVYDHLLWSSNIMEEEYIEFKTTYLPFNLPFMRDIYDSYAGRASLVDLAIQKLEKSTNPQALKSAEAIMKLCNMQKSFRKPHKKLADDAYDKQEKKEETVKTKGSGGYSTDILSYIMELSEQKTNGLNYAIKLKTQESESSAMELSALQASE